MLCVVNIPLNLEKVTPLSEAILGFPHKPKARMNHPPLQPTNSTNCKTYLNVTNQALHATPYF